MKKSVFLALFIVLFSNVSHTQNFPVLDKSPMDMAYFPDNFPHDRKAGETAIIRVIYSRPFRNGREVFGNLVPYGKVWRTGANEATEIKFYRDVNFGGKQVKAGTYSLFTIPAERAWTIIFNNDLDYWGAYSYNSKNDVLRFTAPVSQLNNTVENFTIHFATIAGKKLMRLAWDKTVIEVPFTY